MAQQSQQPLSTLRNLSLSTTITLGLMPWLSWLVRNYIQKKSIRLEHQQTSDSISTDLAEPNSFQDHNHNSTWYAWFDDNINDFYTADPSEAAQPLDPTDLVNTLLTNHITLWHHPEFAPWLATLIEPAFYQWPAEIACETELTQPQQVRSPKTQQKLANALSSLPTQLIHNIHIHELILMYLGAGYGVLEQLAKTPLAKKTTKEREQRHQERYAQYHNTRSS